MKANPPVSFDVISAWRPVIEQIEQSLHHSLERATDIEKPASGVVSIPGIEALDERLIRLDECLDRAGQSAAELTALLESETAAMKRWLESMNQAVSRMEEWTKQTL